MKYVKTFVYAVLAGIAISIGGTVYLASVPDFKVVGALLFAVGLMTICFYKLNLYTGKICYVFEEKPSYILDLMLIWLGNYLGAFLSGKGVAYALPTLHETATTITEKKLAQSPLQTLILGIFCGILVFIAVDIFKKSQGASRFIGIFTCIPLFILAGFEHSIADMFYVSASANVNSYPFEQVVFVLIVTLGNSIGGILIPLARKLFESKEE